MVRLVAGTMFLMWLGEQITERGIGNGISLLIFAGIVSDLPSALGAVRRASSTRLDGDVAAFFIIMLLVAVTFAASSSSGVTAGSRQYAKRLVGNKVYGGQSSHLPLKMTMPGSSRRSSPRRSFCCRRPW